MQYARHNLYTTRSAWSLLTWGTPQFWPQHCDSYCSYSWQQKLRCPMSSLMHVLRFVHCQYIHVHYERKISRITWRVWYWNTMMTSAQVNLVQNEALHCILELSWFSSFATVWKCSNGWCYKLFCTGVLSLGFSDMLTQKQRFLNCCLHHRLPVAVWLPYIRAR